MRGLSQRRLARLLLVLALVGLVAGLSAAVGSASRAAPRTQLIIAEEDIAPSLNPDGSNAGHPGTEAMNINLMEPLLTYPSKKVGDVLTPNYKVGPSEFEPRLATSWTKNGLVWTMKLRAGVKSCAGNTFSADDVIYTFQRAMSVSGPSLVSWFLGNVSAILPLAPVLPKATAADKTLKKEVVKVDDLTVKFTQANPNELFPRALEIFALYPWDSKVMKAHATAADPWSHKWVDTTDLPGYGPYCLKKWNKGSEIDLSANPNYYRGQPQFKTIIWRKVPATSNRIGAIQSGAADIVTHLSPTEINSVDKSGKAKVLSYFNNIVLPLGMSYKFPPWNSAKNALLRQAVAYAIPYNEIIKEDYLGNAKQWYGQCESSYYGFVGDTRYKTDIAKAKELIAQAGFPGGKGLPSSGLTLYYVAERRSLMEPIANRIRTSLAQIGMNITLAPISNTEYTDRRLTKYDMPMYIDDGDRPLGPDIGYCSLLWYVSKANGGLVTDSSYSNPAFDALYKISASTIGAPRLATMKKMQAILMNELPKIPMVEPKTQLAVAKDITDWQSTTYDIPYFWTLKTTS